MIGPLRERLSGLALPDLTRVAEIDVYLVHNSPEAEDYFFLFDFEEFAERSRRGWFVRPQLRIFAGRDDFSRKVFARQFREVFATEFDRMRAELERPKGKGGWLDWRLSPLDLVGGLVSNLVLAVALSVGRQVLGPLKLPRLLAGKSAAAKLADEIEQTKGQVEDALARIVVTLHRELYDHAYRHGGGGRVSGLDRDAWPLPDYVRGHLGRQESGSWW